MNLTTVTMAHFAKLDPVARRAKLTEVVEHNLLPPARSPGSGPAAPGAAAADGEQRAAGYTHLSVKALYDEPYLRRTVDKGLAEAGALARSLGVRLSFHPGPFCLIASRNPAAIENGLSELDYHAELFGLMGYGDGWHPHGAHINIHVGAGDPGVAGFARPCPGRAASPGTS